MQSKKPTSKYIMQIKQSKTLIVPLKIIGEDLDKLLLMKSDAAARYFCKQLKEINTRLIFSIISDLWSCEQDSAAKRTAMVSIYHKVCTI